MANSGIAPLDASSDIGKVRLTAGDTSYVPLVPPVSGYGDYQLFSDQEIEVFLENASDSILGAAGYGFMSLAGQAALASQSVSDYDLKISTEKRAADLRAQAEFFFGQAGIIGGGEYFDIVATGTTPTAAELAELAYTSTDPIDGIW